MAGGNDEDKSLIEFIEKFAGMFSGALDEAIGDASVQADKMAAKKKAIEREIARDAEREAENLIELRLKGHLETEKQVAEYAQGLREESAQEDLKDKIRALDAISAKSKKAREKEKKESEKQLKKAELRATGNKKDEKKANRMDSADAFGDVFKKNFSAFRDQLEQGPLVTVAETNAENMVNTLKGVGAAISEGLNQINRAISTYASYQTQINTRLQGYTTFDNIAKTLDAVAFSPLIDAEKLYSNLNAFVEKGVASNVEQRAFLATIKEGVASTFDADSPALLRLIRVQQRDSTAARLGMESYLTRFLNEFVESTEYLTSTFDTVADSLLEASALLGQNSGDSKASAEFEYIVQKWLGVLTGVGVSDSTATAIASAIGQLGSGDVSSVGSSGVQNLLVMAASNSGLDFGALLNAGLDAADTNKLLFGLTEYLQEIGTSSSNIVKNQLSELFGVTVSDLVSVSNLSAKELATTFDSAMSTSNMYSELYNQMNTMTERMGIANILENLFSNVTYQTGMRIASNPALYATWKITDLIEQTTGGINIPFVTALGAGVDLNATVEQLMKLGIVGVSTLSGIGNIINGVSSIANGGNLLGALAIGEGTTAIEGGVGLSDYTLTSSGLKKRVSGTTFSSSTYVGNADSAAYTESALGGAREKYEEELDMKRSEDLMEDPVVKYLTDLDLGGSLSSIVKDVGTIVAEGVAIKLNAASSSSFDGFYTASI